VLPESQTPIRNNKHNSFKLLKIFLAQKQQRAILIAQ